MSSARPLLLVQARDDIADDWLQAHVDAAVRAYPAMDVAPLRGLQIDVQALAGRDVVIWPWMGGPTQRALLRPVAAVLARSAQRVRIIAPSVDEAIGPADLNGHDPVAWARRWAETIEPSEEVDLDAEWFGGAALDDGHELADVPLEETHERVSDYVPAIIDDLPDPVDLFTRAPLPALEAKMLPPALAPFIFDQSQIIGSDPCILAIASLVSCAAVTSDAIKLQPKEHEHGWRESARLWGAFVGDPSVKKTPPLNRATSHLRKLDMDYAEKGAEAMQRYKIARKVYEKAEAKWIDDQAKHRPTGPLEEPPERPIQRRIIVQDATIEAVAGILVDNPEGVLAIFDELSGFFGSMDAYRAQGGKDRSFWLQAYNGGPYAVDRVSREAVPVPNLSVSMLGGIQPAAIRQVAAKSVEDGLLQRFMIVCAEGGSAIGEDRRADTEALALYRGIIDRLAAERPANDTPITLDADARALMIHVERKLQAFVAMDDLPIRMRYQLGKWSGLFARVALTFHAIECAALGIPVAGRVALDLVERVDRFLFEFLFWHLQHFYESVIGGTEPKEALTIKVANWLLAKAPDRFTDRDITKGVSAWAKAEWWNKRAVMVRLVNFGWINEAHRTRADADAWSLNTRVREKFADHAEHELLRRQTARDMILGKDNESFTE